MRHAITVAVLLALMSAGASAAETTAQPKRVKHATKAMHAKPTRAKAEQMSPEKRRDLEQRIEALERKYEMQPAEQPGAR